MGSLRWPHSAGGRLGAAAAGMASLSLPGSLIFKEVGPSFSLLSPQHSKRARRTEHVPTRCPSFSVFADVPVPKACHMAKPSVTMEAGDAKGMYTAV